jgi:PAS domain S-box-containing protein
MPNLTSLYDRVRATLGERVKPVLYTKSALVHLSHLLEDMVLTHRLPALMFTGFQESSHWAQETARYQELANVARQVCIFAGKPLPEEHAVNLVQVELERDDPLLQEWFVVILSQRFSVLLCGKDQPTDGDVDDDLREFETLISFDASVIESVLDTLEDVLAQYRPDILPTLKTARAQFPPSAPDAVLFTEVMNGMMGFEMSLNRALSRTNEALLTTNHHLSQQRDLNERMVQSSNVLMILTDTQGRIVNANKTFWRVVGKKGQNQRTEFLTADFWHEDDRVVLRHRFRQLLDGEQVEPLLMRAISNGEERQIELQLILMRDMRGEAEFVYAIGVDVSARQRAQQLLMEQEILRVSLEKERDLADLRLAFMIAVSHEFRTPLTTILSSVQLLEMQRDTLTPEVLTRRLSRIKGQVSRLTELIERMVAVIEGDNPYRTIHLIELNLVAWLEGLLQDVRLATDSTHEVILTVEGFTHDEVVRADETLLRQIVVNLVHNAIKFSPHQKQVWVTLKRLPAQLELQVRDEGIGILPEDKPRMFGAFFRGRNASAFGGVGLGLKIVNDSVATYKGTVSYTSEAGSTVFTVRLPLPQEE